MMKDKQKMASEGQRSSNDLAVERTNLAVERTVMAANRTLMGWVRTGLSLISFGFTIYKIFISAIPEKLLLMDPHKPRRIGLFLITLGTVSLVLGAIEYAQTIKWVDAVYAREYKTFNYAFFVAMLLVFLGLFLIITILIHKEVF